MCLSISGDLTPRQCQHSRRPWSRNPTCRPPPTCSSTPRACVAKDATRTFATQWTSFTGRRRLRWPPAAGGTGEKFAAFATRSQRWSARRRGALKLQPPSANTNSRYLYTHLFKILILSPSTQCDQLFLHCQNRHWNCSALPRSIRRVLSRGWCTLMLRISNNSASDCCVSESAWLCNHMLIVIHVCVYFCSCKFFADL